MAKGTEANLWGWGTLLCDAAGFVTCIRTFIRTTGKLSTGLMYRLRKESFEAFKPCRFPSSTTMQWAGWYLESLPTRPALPIWFTWGTLDLFWGVPLIMGISIVLLVLDWQLRFDFTVVALFPFLAFDVWVFNQKILDSSGI